MLEVCRQTVREKCWPRRHRRTTEVCALVLIVSVASTAHSQPPEPEGSSLPPVLERFLDEVQTLNARFEQNLYTADQRLVESSSGTVAIKRPNRLRWIYEEPLETQLVTDGETLWMYDVEIAQVTRSEIDEAPPASPALLLSGNQAVRDSFEVVQTVEEDGLTWITLRPTLAGGDFSVLRLAFDDAVLSRMEFVDGLDQTTTIEFLEIELNPELDDALFRFDVPRGVDVLGGAG